MAQDYGFKYCIPQKSLLNKDEKDIGFSSRYNTLKTHISGLISKSVATNVYTTIEVAHGLPYRPAFNGYYRDTISGEVYPISSGFPDSGSLRSGTNIEVSGKSNNYNLTFTLYNDTGATRNIDIFYEVFYEDLVSDPVRIYD
jgi:hypothetical protein